MSKKTVPFTKEEMEKITETYPTPFHIYDKKAIVDNIHRLQNAFSWAPEFKEYFAVKATPNPSLLKILQGRRPRRRLAALCQSSFFLSRSA